MNKYKIGDKIRIIDAGYGAKGCNGKIGTVTDKLNNNGLSKYDKGFNLEVFPSEIWRVNENGNYELTKQNNKTWGLSNTQVYEQQPYNLTVLVKDGEEIIQVQNLYRDISSYKVIYNNPVTVVILQDGTKGIARCMDEDIFSKQIGHDIALNRARISKLQNELKNLTH